MRCVLITVRACLDCCACVLLMIGVMSTKRIVYNGTAGAAGAADDDSAAAAGAGVGCAAAVSICVVC